MVFIVRQTWVLVYFPFANTSIFRTAVLYFRLAVFNAFSYRQTPCLAQALIQPQCSYRLYSPGSYQYPTRRRNRCNKMARHIDVLSMCQSSRFNFLDSLVIFRHNFTGKGKVSCMLATNPIDFLRKKFKNESCAVVFSSYWTKHELPAGNQF